MKFIIFGKDYFDQGLQNTQEFISHVVNKVLDRVIDTQKKPVDLNYYEYCNFTDEIIDYPKNIQPVLLDRINTVADLFSQSVESHPIVRQNKALNMAAREILESIIHFQILAAQEGGRSEKL